MGERFLERMRLRFHWNVPIAIALSPKPYMAAHNNVEEDRKIIQAGTEIFQREVLIWSARSLCVQMTERILTVIFMDRS